MLASVSGLDPSVFKTDDSDENRHPTEIALKAVARGDVRKPRLRLVVVNDTLLNTFLLPEGGKVMIGRAQEAAIYVPHASVSRQHARLHVGAELALEDLGSSNGTSVNNIRIVPQKPVPLQPGDLIRMGEVLLIVQSEWNPTEPEDKEPTRELLLRDGKNLKATATGLDIVIDGQAVVVKTEAMKRIMSLVARVATTNMNVLVLGETGTGKEVIARSIHVRSKRKDKRFLSLNCAALSEPLLESELFGHEKGAFTGAHEAKIGLLEKANGGTVFLDEIGDMSLAIQAKLLRVFEERQVLRLGSLVPRPIDVCFVTATNKNVSAEVAEGRFRKDFYFRLSGMTIHVPPLRERTAEIEPLARLFIEGFAAKSGWKAAPELTAEVLEALCRYSWPGNIRELRNVVERAVLLAGEGPILPEHLAFEATEAPPPVDTGLKTRPIAVGATFGPSGAASSLSGEVASLERERIAKAMETCAGNQTRAAELLGMPRRTLLRKLDAYGIARPRKQPGTPP